jgi:hypothetical protein
MPSTFAAGPFLLRELAVEDWLIERNSASAQVAERSGFVRTGQSPDEHRGAPVVLNRWLWSPSPARRRTP